MKAGSVCARCGGQVLASYPPREPSCLQCGTVVYDPEDLKVAYELAHTASPRDRRLEPYRLYRQLPEAVTARQRESRKRWHVAAAEQRRRDTAAD